jgi:hypothetical protein
MSRLDPLIESFRFAHHNIAMMFAVGMTVQEVVRRTGFTPRRLSILLNDPTFLELIEHYRKPHADKLKEDLANSYADMGTAFNGYLRHVIQNLENHDEEDETVPLAHAMKVVSDLGDRIGYSKHTIKTNLNVSFAAALDRAIERSGKRPELKVIEQTPIPARALVEQTPAPMVTERRVVRRF